jgi:hypothetical protein
MTSAAGVEAVSRLRSVAVRSVFRTGSELVALFEQVRHVQDKVQWVHRNVAADLAGPLDPALDRACAAIAADIDSQAPAFDHHPYHNRQHFCEVALTAHVLCFLNQLEVRTTQFVLLAALIHDYVHYGGSHQAFLQERASVERARPLLEAAGLEPSQINRLMVLVLSTESSGGTDFMAAVCSVHKSGDDVAIAAPQRAPELAALVTDPELAQLARILCEADVLPSIGLKVEHAMHLQERLSREWRRPLDEKDKLAFIDRVLQQGFIGDFFLPNVQATRDILARKLHALVQS